MSDVNPFQSPGLRGIDDSAFSGQPIVVAGNLNVDEYGAAKWLYHRDNLAPWLCLLAAAIILPVAAFAWTMYKNPTLLRGEEQTQLIVIVGFGYIGFPLVVLRVIVSARAKRKAGMFEDYRCEYSLDGVNGTFAGQPVRLSWDDFERIHTHRWIVLLVTKNRRSVVAAKRSLDDSNRWDELLSLVAAKVSPAAV